MLVVWLPGDAGGGQVLESGLWACIPVMGERVVTSAVTRTVLGAREITLRKAGGGGEVCLGVCEGGLG